MTSDHGQRLYAAFQAALNCDAWGRAAMLAELSSSDPELFAELEGLLAQDAEAERDGFLSSPASTDRAAFEQDISTKGESGFFSSQRPEGTDCEAQVPSEALPPGLANHPDYLIKHQLGQGGMGRVYLAVNRLMGRTEVLKVMAPEIADRPGALERFVREIRAVAGLRHPNIVAAHHATRLGNSILFAMEHADGVDLARLVEAEGRLSVASACDYARQAALALEHAHQNGMVHRDIKPSNLMLVCEGNRDVVKVLDFGLAKVMSEAPTDRRLTYDGQIVGTPDFTAPEQIRNAGRADIRADIYSLGATLYYLLTGAPPFDGTSLYDIFEAHRYAEATPLNRVRPDVPVELAALVAKMMDKKPEQRFQTPSEVAEALLTFVDRQPSESTLSYLEPIASAAAGLSANGIGNSSERERSGGLRIGTATAEHSSASQDPETASLGAFKFDESRQLSATAAPAPIVARKWALPTLRRRVWAPAAMIAILSALSVAAVLIFKTKNGTIIFQNLPERSVVTVNGDTFAVEWPDGKGKGHAQITIQPGKYAVEVAVNGVRVKGKEVSVQAGRITPFVVRFDQPERSPERQASSTDSVDRVPQHASNSIGMTLVLIPAGEFVMGYDDGDELEKPAHLVRISSEFYLGAHEVTQSQYETIMGKNPSSFANQPRNPVDSVTWLEAVTFCNRLSEREMLAAYYRIDGAYDVAILGGTGYRLPTEAEREYVGRARNKSDIPFLTNAPLFEVGWVMNNSERKTHPVGEKKPNRFGLYDVYGNVWEWCWDWHGKYQYRDGKAIDPMGAPSGTLRVARGNGWYNGDPLSCRPGFRLALPPDKTSTNRDVGFRVAAGGRDGLPVISAGRSAAKPEDKPPASSGVKVRLRPE